MGNRCEQCNRWVSLATQEPEVNSVDISGTTVTLDCRSVRNCQECLTEMKALDINEELELELDGFEGFSGLGEKKQEQLREAWDAGTIEIEVAEDGGSTDEAGGGSLTTTVAFTAKFSWEGLGFTYSGKFSCENAASEYDDV